MIIGVDVRFALRPRRGIGNYILMLVKHLASVDSENTYILYGDRDDTEEVLPKNHNFKFKKLLPNNYIIWEQVVLPLQTKRDQLDILHCGANTSPILSSGKLILTLHDVMYLKDYFCVPKSDSWWQRLVRLYSSANVLLSARRASKIITVSNFSKQDILYHLRFLSESSIVPIYESIDERFQVLDLIDAKQKIQTAFGISEDYLLTLGAVDPRKNTKIVIQAFAELKHDKQISGKLVVVGIPKLQRGIFNEFIKSLEIQSQVCFTDFVSSEDLVCLYRAATLFLYPSLYEGFGVPPLEAMCCGTPVITSNVTSIPEITGDAAFLIDPTNKAALKTAIVTLLNNKKIREAMIKRGLKRVKQFSWQQMARETLKVYEQTVGLNNVN